MPTPAVLRQFNTLQSFTDYWRKLSPRSFRRVATWVGDVELSIFVDVGDASIRQVTEDDRIRDQRSIFHDIELNSGRLLHITDLPQERVVSTGDDVSAEIAT